MDLKSKIINLLVKDHKPNRELPIYFDPSPLVSRKEKIGLFWTPKSGCTLAVKWFFFQTGNLEEALEYDPWIHNYRTDKYQNRSDYYKLLNNLDLNSYRFVKFARNPYTRAVSSFFHVLMMYQNTDPRMAKIKKDTLKVFLPNGEDSLSFRGFVDILHKNINNSLDAHIARQYHPLESKLESKPFVVQIENFQEELEKFEQLATLKKSNQDKIFDTSHHKRKKSREIEFVGDKVFKHTKDIPSYGQFYDEHLKEKVYEIFKIDFESYGYSKEFNL